MSCDCFKTVICNCSSLIFKKMPVACIIGLKTNELWGEALKMHLVNAVKTSVININSFTKVT